MATEREIEEEFSADWKCSKAIVKKYVKAALAIWRTQDAKMQDPKAQASRRAKHRASLALVFRSAMRQGDLKVAHSILEHQAKLDGYFGGGRGAPLGLNAPTESVEEIDREANGRSLDDLEHYARYGVWPDVDSPRMPEQNNGQQGAAEFPLPAVVH
jgi:hypothetical protein